MIDEFNASQPKSFIRDHIQQYRHRATTLGDRFSMESIKDSARVTESLPSISARLPTNINEEPKKQKKQIYKVPGLVESNRINL